MTNIPRSEFKDEIRKLEFAQFKQLIAELWSSWGWETQVLGSQKESAINIVATCDELFQRKEIIHIRQYGSEKLVPLSAVRNCNASRHSQSDADSVVLLTTGRFSRDAELLGSTLNVKLVEPDKLYSFVRQGGYFDLVYEYI